MPFLLPACTRVGLSALPALPVKRSKEAFGIKMSSISRNVKRHLHRQIHPSRYNDLTAVLLLNNLLLTGYCGSRHGGPLGCISEPGFVAGTHRSLHSKALQATPTRHPSCSPRVTCRIHFSISIQSPSILLVGLSNQKTMLYSSIFALGEDTGTCIKAVWLFHMKAKGQLPKG